MTILFLVDNGIPSLRLDIFVLVGDVDVVDVDVDGRVVVVDEVIGVGAAVDVVVDDDVEVDDVVGIGVDVVGVGVDVAADVESLSVVVSIT